MSDLTVVYYTSNRENPEFQKRMQQTLLDTIGDMPLISVSHKPMDFGKNICVGDKVPSSHNAFRQMQIGAMEAKTKYICTAEVDTLYPREYFDFRPEREDRIYKANHIYVICALRNKSHFFQAKKEAEGAIVVGRDYIIGVVEKQLEGKGIWGNKDDYNGNITLHLFKYGDCDTFHTAVPVIQFKTDNNLHRKTPVRRDKNTYELPYWGKSHDLLRRYCENREI